MKHLIDVDEDALSVARATLGTVTIRDTVNEALRRAADVDARRERIEDAISVLARVHLSDEERQDAWS